MLADNNRSHSLFALNYYLLSSHADAINKN
jgi:hypothetical protein